MSQIVPESRTKRAFPIAVLAAGALTAATLTACGGGGSSAAPGGGLVAASAFPATSFAFASVDVNPTDGEKGQLIGTLLKFPAFARKVNIGPTDDVRKVAITEALKHQDTSKCTLTWDADFAPWLGTVMGVAGVESKGEPEPVGAIQVTDATKAGAEYKKLVGCFGDPGFGIVITDKWVYLAKSKAVAQAAIDGAKSGTLADDATFKKWTAKAGGGGFLTAYAAPSVADIVGKVFDKLQASDSAFAQGFNQGLAAESYNPFADICPALGGDPSAFVGQMKTALKAFQGAALEVRAKNGGLEIEGSLGMDSGSQPANWPANSDLTKLSSNTAAAISVGLPENFWDQIMASLAKSCGPKFNRAKLEAQIADATGMNVPGDLNAVLGKGLTLALGGGVDLSKAEGPADIPAALLLNGDPSKAKDVVDKLLAQFPPSFNLKTSTKGNDVIVSTNDAYAGSVTSGGLGDNATFRDVVPNASGSQMVMFVNFDEIERSLSDVPEKILENLRPLKALGLSMQSNGTEGHFFIRVSTN